MRTNMTESIKRQIKYWWVSLIVGILAVAVGIMSYEEPVVTIGVLTIFFIASILVSGIFDIVLALYNRNSMSEWGWLLAGGIVSLVFAFILMALPVANMAIFIYYVAFYIMLQSFMQIWASVTLKRYEAKNWTPFLILGILGLILSLIMVFEVSFAITFIIIIFSASLICYGLFRIFFAFRLRKFKNLLEE